MDSSAAVPGATSTRQRIGNPFSLKRLSTGGRVALALTGTVIIATALLATLTLVVYQRQLGAERDRALLGEAEAYAAAMQSVLSRGAADVDAVSAAYLGARSPTEGTVLLVRLSEGRLLATSRTPLRESSLNLSLLDPARATRSFAEVAVNGEAYRVATMPVRDPSGRVVTVFEAASAASSLGHATSGMLRAFVVAGLVVALIGVLLSKMVARGSLRPLRDAGRAAGEIGVSSLSRRVPYQGPVDDDVGLLVGSLNGMLDRLDRSFAEQRLFVADASHELRTPITVVRGHLEVMREQGGLNADQEETLTLVTEELERMGNLVSDLLSLARLEAGDPPPYQLLDLGEVVEESVMRAQGLGRRRFAFTHGGPLPVFGNRDLLLQAILNVLSNAVRHTADEGRVTVVCRRDGQRALVSVADDGPGIPEADLERIFDRFYRGTPRPLPGQEAGNGGGSGLGLAIARGLVELHGGRLRAFNAASGGAVFEIALPLKLSGSGRGLEALGPGDPEPAR